MLAHGKERPTWLLEHDARVAGRPTFGIEQAVLGRLLALVLRHARLADGDLAGRHVEDHRRAVLARQGRAERIGAEPRLGAAVGRLQGRMIDHVDEVDRGKACARTLLGVVTDAADMEAVADREQRHALLPGAGHAQLHRLMADHLAVAAVTLDHQDSAALADQLGVTVGHELSGADLVHVDRQQTDAVRIVTGQVRLDQMAGHQGRLMRAAAARGAERMAQRTQLLARDDRHQAARGDMTTGP